MTSGRDTMSTAFDGQPGGPNPVVVYFERWSHAVALEMLDERPHLDVRRLAIDDPERAVWDVFSGAHVYQIRSTRSELPEAYRANAGLIERAPELLAVSTTGAGFDTVDLDACTAGGVIVVNQAGGNKEAVAEHALGMILCLAKRIVEADRAVRSIPSLERETLMGHDILGRTLGIVGLGHVGTRMAELGRTLFRMRVLACDPYLTDAQFAERGAERVAFDELLRESDYVTVHCPRTAETEGLFGAAEFTAMPAHACFVNTARGGIHDELALAAALADGVIAGAGVDVWEDEPPPLDHPLLAFDNVIVTPHTAGVTHESRRNMARGTVEQIDRLARGERPPRLLNPGAWDTYCERFERILGRRPAA